MVYIVPDQTWLDSKIPRKQQQQNKNQPNKQNKNKSPTKEKSPNFVKLATLLFYKQYGKPVYLNVGGLWPIGHLAMS